jgi:hypothetical protein
MTPNNVDCDTYPEKSPEWGKAINAMIRDVARDFNCCFIDTFAIWQDATNGQDWMDSYLVHPQNVANIWITSKIFDVVLPAYFRKASVASIPTTATLTLQNSWANYGSTYDTAGYYKSGGRVHLSGVITGGGTTLGTVIANLPIGFRPSKDKFFTVACGGTNRTARLYITSAGDLKIDALTANTWLGLEEISFLASA